MNVCISRTVVDPSVQEVLDYLPDVDVAVLRKYSLSDGAIAHAAKNAGLGPPQRVSPERATDRRNDLTAVFDTARQAVMFGQTEQELKSTVVGAVEAAERMVKEVEDLLD